MNSWPDRAPLRAALRALLATVLAFGAIPVATPSAVRGADSVPPGSCHPSAEPVARADQLMANLYAFAPFKAQELPADLAWTEDPLADRNWAFQLHSLTFVDDLLRAWQLTGSEAYRDRGVAILDDWMRDNPRSHPPSVFSWNDHSAAFRAMTYACAADLLGLTDKLRAALVLHGATLASPSFYVKHGNHAVNQSLGLLEAGRVLHRKDWELLARDRLNTLVAESIDSQGVSVEQSVMYHYYNYKIYMQARARLAAVGFTPGPAFSRVGLMPRFTNASRLPNGTAESIGDTDRQAPATANLPGACPGIGAGRGPLPATVSVYRAGYLFARTGWGAKRACSDETFVSARWGPRMRSHGHADAGSVTLVAWGESLLVDPGRYTYNFNPLRAFFLSRAAHNVVVVDGLSYNASVSTALLSSHVTAASVDVRLRLTGYAGVSHTRRVTVSRGLGYVIVDDRLRSLRRQTFRQAWHLAADAAPSVSGPSVVTRRERGNVRIRQLAGPTSWRLVSGSFRPLQGWVSPVFGTLQRAPVVMAIRTGTSVRYLTLLVTAKGWPTVTVTGLRMTADGYCVTVTMGGFTERVVAGATTVKITPVGPTPTPTPKPTPTPSPPPTPTPSPTASQTGTPGPTDTPTAAPVPTPVPSVNPTPVPAPAAAETPGPSREPTPNRSVSPSPPSAPDPTPGASA